MSCSLVLIRQSSPHSISLSKLWWLSIVLLFSLLWSRAKKILKYFSRKNCSPSVCTCFRNVLQLEKRNMSEKNSLENPNLKRAELFALCVSESFKNWVLGGRGGAVLPLSVHVHGLIVTCLKLWTMFLTYSMSLI